MIPNELKRDGVAVYVSLGWTVPGAQEKKNLSLHLHNFPDFQHCVTQMKRSLE
jgi:hypothetical protein